MTTQRLIGESLKRLSDEFLTFLPERFGIFCIERISTYAFADSGDGRVVRHDLADVAVLAISAANLVGRSDHGGPHRCCSSLRDGLELEGRLTLCGELLIDFFDDFFEAAGVDVAIQFRSNASWMHSCGPHTVAPVPFVKCDCEENIRCFGSAIGNERIIGRALEIWVLKIDVRVAMPGRRQIDEPPTGANETRNPVDQDEVA